MTTHTDRIKQMAQDAGFPSMTVDNLSQQDAERLSRFAQLVAEDCARVAYGKVAEGLAHNAHVEIRARYGCGDPSTTQPIPDAPVVDPRHLHQLTRGGPE